MMIIADGQPSYWFTGHYLSYKNTSHGYKGKNVFLKTLTSKAIFNMAIFNVTTFRRAVRILSSIFMMWHCQHFFDFGYFFSFSNICSLPGGIPLPLVNAFTVFSSVGPKRLQRGPLTVQTTKMIDSLGKFHNLILWPFIKQIIWAKVLFLDG